jgi:gliding motility-associated lipoprotein GldH
MKSSRLPVFLVLSFALMFHACTTIDVYEKTAAMPMHEWKEKNTPSFTFTISDTTPLYNIFVVLRHTDAYHFNNIWLNLTTKTPLDSTAAPQSLNLQLADNRNGWLGTGMDDIYEHRIKIAGPSALHKGNYTFTLQHIMREEPLQFILNAGIRVEKAK